TLTAAGMAARCAAGREGSNMIAASADVKVMLATKPVDFRKGADGLAALVREQLRHDPFAGTILVFRSKRADRLKILAWDGSGRVAPPPTQHICNTTFLSYRFC
ncbi:MAG: IS66 family insertion sequence element accessory protein TnpB, partial [Burkholderiales bacterium]